MKAKKRNPRNRWQEGFLEILPTIERQLKFAFRDLNEDARDEAVQEGIVNCCLAYERLVRLGRINVAYPCALARFAVLRIRAGRSVGCRANVRDPLSRYSQLQQGHKVEQFEQIIRQHGDWIGALVDQRQTPVPEQAAFRVDVPRWLSGLAARSRKIARELAMGWSPGELCAKYRLSASRISQIRQELHRSWQTFHGSTLPSAAEFSS